MPQLLASGRYRLLEPRFICRRGRNYAVFQARGGNSGVENLRAPSAWDGVWSEEAELVPGDCSGGREPVKNKPIRLPDGTLALCCNPVGSDWGARSPLSLMLSCDNGKSWTKELDLATGDGEYSHPTVICGADQLHIAFTYRRKSVMYAQVSF